MDRAAGLEGPTLSAPASASASDVGFTSSLYTVLFLLSTTFFFFDVSYLPRGVTAMCAWVVLVLILLKRSAKLRPVSLLLLGYPAYYNLLKFVHYERYAIVELLFPTGLVTICAFMLLIGERRGCVLLVIKKFCNAIAILNAPSLVIYAALTLNVPLSYQLINLGGRGLHYRNYYNLAIIVEGTIHQIGGITLARLNGLYEEPGMLGTIVTFLLAADMLVFTGVYWRKGVLLLLGLFSFSLTFYVIFGLMLAGAVMRSSGPRARRFALVSFVSVGILVPAVWAIPGLRAAVHYVIGERIGALFGGGGTWDSGEVSSGRQFSGYLDSASAAELTFGTGPRASASEGPVMTTYRETFYEVSAIGCAFALVFPVYWLGLKPVLHRQYALALIAFPAVGAFYHRPEVFSAYVGILYAAMGIAVQSDRRSADAERR
jgi:hypothetical protein